MNVVTGFGRLITRIQPTENERLSAQQHLYTIKNRLTATFNIRKFLNSGSFARNTFIHNGNDVDLFVVLARKDVTHGDGWVSSTTVLKNIREELMKRYRDTEIRTDAQAVVVCFSQGANVDVVPAVFDKMLPNNWPLYAIPDGDGGWMHTSPELHNRFIATADTKSGGKLRRVAQFLKFWRECRLPSVPISSFHIEMVLASEGTCVGVKSYAACVTETFQLLAQRECRGLQDPLQISGNISAVKTEAQREGALASVRHSRDHAKDACIADYGGNSSEACRQWNIVFNGNFPQ